MSFFDTPDFHSLQNREWIVANGIGGYASSTLSGANTRRYHGLLVASLRPPGERKVLVSKIEERLIGEAETIPLSTNRYPNAVHPEGYRFLTAFDRNPVPKAVFQSGPYALEKSVFMVNGSNTTVVEYANAGNAAFELELIPLFVFRDYHGLFRADEFYDFFHREVEAGKMEVFAHYGATPFYFSFSKGQFQADPLWFYQLEYEKEKYRGLDFQEDAKSIGQIRSFLEPGERMFLVFSTQREMTESDPEALKLQELQRLESLELPGADTFLNDLVLSGDQFLVWRESSESYSLLAGFHWFMDWGRDAMIAMRGLTIALGKKEESQSIIRTFLQYLDGGMLPNRFPDHGEAPEYNTIDATLWLFVVLYEFQERFGDLEFVKEVFPKLTEILRAHQEGTRYGIHVTEEGLLYGGEGIAQLTWMDARIGDYVVTPRHGCPVEVNALWYNALRIYSLLGRAIGEDVAAQEREAERFQETFRRFFLNDQGALNDVVVPGRDADASTRPNQIYAVSLPFSPLEEGEMKGVLRAVEDHLYTDLGLRSLSVDHPDFKPVYGGDVWERDTAYHQGTVWAFLWGEWALAYLKVHGYDQDAIHWVEQRSDAMRRHFYEEDCIHGISEIFDGREPGPGRGCIQQAWSIGMLIKVLMVLKNHSSQQSPE